MSGYSILKYRPFQSGEWRSPARPKPKLPDIQPPTLIEMERVSLWIRGQDNSQKYISQRTEDHKRYRNQNTKYSPKKSKERLLNIRREKVQVT